MQALKDVIQCTHGTQVAFKNAKGLVAYQVNSIRGHALAEDLAPGVRCDLGELELGVVGVHAVDHLPGGGP